MNWKTFRVPILIAAVCAGLITLLFIGIPSRHKLVLKAYFADGIDLRAGAPVRLAGVDLGYVKTVRVRPELRECPVEVTMVLVPPYEIKIPNDSVATLSTAGLLGGTYVALDITNAVGPPAHANAVLKTIPFKPLSTDELLKRIDEILRKKDCDVEQIKAAIAANSGKAAAGAPH